MVGRGFTLNILNYLPTHTWELITGIAHLDMPEDCHWMITFLTFPRKYWFFMLLWIWKWEFLDISDSKERYGGVQTRTRLRLASGCPVAFIVPNNWSVAQLPQKNSNCHNCPWQATKTARQPTSSNGSERAGSKASASQQAFTKLQTWDCLCSFGWKIWSN